MDCVHVLQLNDDERFNVINAILPTLLCQIDGVLSDFLDAIGIKWNCLYDDNKDRELKGRKSLYRENVPVVISEQFDSIANGILLEALFKNTYKERLIGLPFKFNRHRIIHGNETDYGRIDYLIRAFMILDFFSGISIDRSNLKKK